MLQQYQALAGGTGFEPVVALTDARQFSKLLQ